ncbi:MAG TPA: flavin reductase family protein [Myxococcaceae bacterium]|jgi:flavin reductase (DIM6/NTAB) family NADH-FMN oxidoreductase RutF|nr:flavin reductase family protein [Myxococcaceae bacterium]
MQTFPPGDVEAFRHLARAWAATVTVVTARRRPGAGGPGVPEVDGFTATAFLTLSLRPPLVAVAVERGAGADSLLTEADHFAVNLLSEAQSEHSLAFARHWEHRTDTWERFPATPDAAGVPLLHGTAGAFSARVRDRIDAGDHLLVIGEVTAVHHGETQRTLVYQHRGYARVGPLD